MVLSTQDDLDFEIPPPKKKKQLPKLPGWVFRDLVWDDEGEVVNFIADSPTGRTYFKNEFDQLDLTKPEAGQGIGSFLEPALEAKLRAGEPIEPVAQALLKQYPTAKPEIAPDLSNLLLRLYPDQFAPNKPAEMLGTLQTQINLDPEQFLRELKLTNMPTESEALLRYLGADQELIDLIVTPQQKYGQLIQTLNNIPEFKGYDVESLTNLIETDPDTFIKQIQIGRWSEEKQTLLRMIGFSDDEINQINPWKMTTPTVKAPVTFLDKVKAFFISDDDGVTARFRERLAQQGGIVGWANRPTVLANLTPTDIVGLGLMVYGGYQAARIGWDMFLRSSLLRNLNSWSKSAGVEIPVEVKNSFINQAMTNLSKKWLSGQAIKTIFKPTKAGFQATPEVVKQTEMEILALVKAEAPVFVPKATQTGAMAFGGVPKEPIPPSVINIASKIAKGIQLTPEEEQFRVNNKVAVENALKTAIPAKPITPAPTPTTRAVVTPPVVPEKVTLEITIPRRADLDAEFLKRKPELARKFEEQGLEWRVVGSGDVLSAIETFDVLKNEGWQSPKNLNENTFGWRGERTYSVMTRAKEVALPKAKAVPEKVTPEVTKDSFDFNVGEIYSNIEVATKDLSPSAQLERLARIDKFAVDFEKASKGIKVKFKDDWYVEKTVDNIAEIIKQIRQETNPSEKVILFSQLKQELHQALVDHPGMNDFYSKKLGVDVVNLFQEVSEPIAIPKAPVTPEVTIPEGVRPNLYAADIEGMMPATAKVVKNVTLPDGSKLVLKSDDGDIYGLINNKEVGFATKLSETETDLSVVMEYRNQGIGTELMRQFQIENPGHPLGGLTEGGAAVIRKLAIPKAEIGQPEAGLQPSMLPEEIATREVRPAGKGRVTQLSMEEQLKLEQARRAAEAKVAAEEAPPEVKEAYEAQAEIEGLKYTLEADPVAQYTINQTVTRKTKQPDGSFKLTQSIRKVGLDSLISIREQNFPQYFTVKQAQALRPYQDWSFYLQKGTKDYNHIPKESVLDTIAQELGYDYTGGIDDLANRVMAIRREKLQIKEAQDLIKTQMTEKPLEPRTELTPEEVKENWETLGQPKLTLKQVDALVGFFADYINEPTTVRAWELTRELRRETLAGKAENLKARAQSLIVQEGITTEEAMKQAIRETLAGELPVATTEYLEGLTAELRDALFAKVAHTLKNEPFEMASTFTALTNALTGKAIPREKPTPPPGGFRSRIFPQGASAYDKLQYVFGDQPKLLKAIDKMATEKKPLKDVVEGIYHETGRVPIPIDQETADYLRGLKTTVLYEPTAFREPIPVAKFEAPIEDAFKQKPLTGMTFMEQRTIVRVLKELGMLPVDIGNLVRANLASFDFSFWRQVKTITPAHPVAFYRANIEAWKAMLSQKSAEANWLKITRDPLYQIYEEVAEKGKDFLRPLELKKGTSQWKGVEEYGYLTGERVLPRLTQKIPWVKISARSFVTGTNEMTWQVFKTHYKAMLRYSEKIASGEIKLKEGEAFDMTKEMTDMAGMIADFTQRASLGKFREAAPVLSAMFFAPRSKLGRILTPRHLVSANPHVRAEAWKDLSLFVGVIGGLVMLGNWLDLWDVETDPRSAEWMSIRIGNLRIDPWAGNRQLAVFYARVVSGTGVSSVTGAEYEVNPISAMTNFIRSSLAPLPSIILDFWTGKNFLGEKVDVANKKQWLERLAPFSAQNIWEAFEEDWKAGVISILPSWVGEGVQTYTGDWKENFTKLGLSKYMDNLAYGITEPKYDTADFWADTSSQFKGVDPATLTEAKGYPPYVRAIAEARIINEHLATLPSDKLVSLNTDPAKGTTFAQYYQMWRDREKLVASGDEEALKAFDADERTRNAEKGNFSQRQFALLNEYWSITDKKKQVEFLKLHEDEIGVKARNEYLRTHPKENAQLAVWGQAKLLTKEAYNQFLGLVKSLDIPDSAIPEMTLPPEGSIDTHFTYQDMVAEGKHGSWEADLLLKKDALKAKVQVQKPIIPRSQVDESIKHIQWMQASHKGFWPMLYHVAKFLNLPGSYNSAEFDKQWIQNYEDISNVLQGIRDGNPNVDEIKRLLPLIRRNIGVDEQAAAIRERDKGLFWERDAQGFRKAAEGLKKVEELLLKASQPIEIPILGVQSYAEWKGLTLSDTPIASLELKTIPEYHSTYNKLEKEDDPDWVGNLDDKVKDKDGLTARDRARAELKATKIGKETYLDVKRRITAIEKGTDAKPIDKKLIDDYVNWKRIADAPGVGSNSAESMLARVDNPALDAFLTDKVIWANEKGTEDKALEPIDQTQIPIWRIDVKYAEDDRYYQALLDEYEGRKETEMTQAFLNNPENESYRKDRRRREAYGLTNSKTGFKFPTTEVENYIAYNELSIKGKRRDRFLVENPEFANSLKDVGQLADLPDPAKVPAVQYDDIYDQYPDQFDEIEGNGKPESDWFEPDKDAREVRDKELRFDPSGKLTEFGLAETRRQAYEKFVPENFVEDYVGYYTIDKEGKPKELGDLPYYEDDWFMMEHQDFYRQVYLGILGKDRLDFRTTPTREVYAKYQEYQRLPTDYWRDLYRQQNPDLEEWGQLKFGWKPIPKQGERKPSQRDIAFGRITQADIEFDRRMAALRAR